MSGVRPLAVLVFLLLAAAISARADFVASTFLSGAGENPVNGSGATGTTTVTYNALLNQLSVTVNFSGLSAPASAGHIHVGVPGINGPVILPFGGFPAATSGTYTTTLTAANLVPSPANGINTFADAVNAIQAGNTYSNLHNSLFPGGEIRGQLAVTASVPMPTAGWGGIGLFAAMVATTLLRRWRSM